MSTMRSIGSAAPLVFALALSAQAPLPATDLVALVGEKAAWSTHEVGVGVVLKQRRFPKLFSGPQSVTVLEVQPSDAIRFDIEAPGKLTRTSAMGEARGALAAINGGMYEPDASPRGLLRLDGTLHTPAAADQNSIGVDGHGRLVLATRPSGDWPEVREALGAHVALVRAGAVVDQGAEQRSIRHPRSAIGTTAEGRVLLVTIDGRTDEAKGTSHEETAQLLVALGCTEAINLDGGGSSTLWVATRGVCNHPCDNRRFDHAGERAVANALLIHAPAVLIVDDDEAQLHGQGFVQIREGSHIHGPDCALWKGEDTGTAVFAAELPFAGRWQAWLWTPQVEGAGAHLRAAVAMGSSAPQLGGTPIRATPGAWAEIGSFDLEHKGRVAAHLTHARGSPFVADAVKFCQVK